MVVWFESIFKNIPYCPVRIEFAFGNVQRSHLLVCFVVKAPPPEFGGVEKVLEKLPYEYGYPVFFASERCGAAVIASQRKERSS